MGTNPLVEFRERRARQLEAAAPVETPSVPYTDGPLWRQVRSCPPPERLQHLLTVDEARAMIRSEIDAYLALPYPTYTLLVNALPGVGKTTAGVLAAEAAAAAGRRVGYYGPRHDFFDDVQRLARKPKDWYEWLPRQTGDDDKPQTCRHTDAISVWLAKGYRGIDFCAGVCGWDYVNTGCPYHAQKERPEPIIFNQHQHLTSGHPLPFSVAIVDENPMGAFLWPWNIPAKSVVPQGFGYDEPLFQVLNGLSGLCNGDLTEGPELLEALGGPQAVLEASSDFSVPDEVRAAADIHSAFEADNADYFHLPQLVPLLRREAEVARKGVAYAHRIIAGGSAKAKAAHDLTLLLRKSVDWAHFPPHVICLDATGNQHIYETLFGRPAQVVNASPKLAGRIFVVTDRSNGKGSFRAADTKLLVDRIVRWKAYARPAVITFQGSKAELGDFDSGHFYAARGTNRFESCDGLIVAGTPMPAQPVIRKAATMLFFNRLKPFDLKGWSDKWVPYSYLAPDGQGREHPAGGYWGDADLEALTWQYREAELIQSVHRARPIHREVDVWLLSNLPIPELPVAGLLTAAEILDLVPPEGLSLYAWASFLAWAESRESVSATDIRAALKVCENTAIKYRDLLAATEGWEMAAVKRDTKGGKQSVKIARVLRGTNRY